MQCHLSALRQKPAKKWRVAPVRLLLPPNCLFFGPGMAYRLFVFARTAQIFSEVGLLIQVGLLPFDAAKKGHFYTGVLTGAADRPYRHLHENPDHCKAL